MILFQDHFLKIKDITYQLNAIDRKVEVEDLITITLKDLPPSFEKFIEMLNITSNDELTFYQLNNKLLQKDRWRKQFGNNKGHDTSKVALAANFKGKGKGSKSISRQKENDKTSDLGNYKNETF